MRAPESVLVTVVKASRVSLLFNINVRKLSMLFLKHAYENKGVLVREQSYYNTVELGYNKFTVITYEVNHLV